MTFLSVERVEEQKGGNNILGEIKESLFGCSLSAVVKVRDWISVQSCTDRRELKIRVLTKPCQLYYYK